MTGPEDRKRVACGEHGALSPATIIPRAVLDACLPPAPGLDDHEEPTPGVLVLDVAVAKTPGEHAGSLVRAGSENDHLVRRTQAVGWEDVVHGGSEAHLRKRAARFLERLYPTATDEGSGDRSPRSPIRPQDGFRLNGRVCESR
jgi:hypothetical protein